MSASPHRAGQVAQLRQLNRHRKARSRARAEQAWEHYVSGKSYLAIAREMGCSTKSVGRYIASILEVEPQYRNQRLTAEEVEHERQVECARLDMLWQEISDALKVTDSENAAAIARLVESGVRVSERRSRLRGLDAPSRVQEQLLSISYKKVDQKVVIEFDQSQIEAPSEPIPDLSVWHNGQLVALPGDGSKDPEPTDQALLAFEGDHNGSSDAAA